MAFHIEKTQNIVSGTVIQEIYYMGDRKWTTDYNHRKMYDSRNDAEKDLYYYGGLIVEE